MWQNETYFLGKIYQVLTDEEADFDLRSHDYHGVHEITQWIMVIRLPSQLLKRQKESVDSCKLSIDSHMFIAAQKYQLTN